ncbi:Rsm22-domain-containing protein [Punctularia strigosozonata HHB-11173 SS5]|uniref:Rsm22-domain-containing protein n=1 Tax=Punctularia strigosozonata (strain HHB-11173) TaxID=741275 RepID=UPI00044181F4|nr:Rsm22-domain-containing protein [Punctularia strigosozonata HHB-11173 SS5]EIN14400.1 Rsm22-domain-containing protein [Punctularia strigosozonata HHB-11173 SS5]
MLRSVQGPSLRSSVRIIQARQVSTQLNAPLKLDPSLRALLADVDISLLKHKHKHLPGEPRELEVWDGPSVGSSSLTEQSSSESADDDLTRKSPAAHFGSQRTGATILPFELYNSISSLIAASDKSQLHSDAKRLFLDETRPGERGSGGWNSFYDVRYNSRHQRELLGERDGTAFATVALPAHYSAILSVFDHLKDRLGPEWAPSQLIDWYAGTGSGLWAALHAFQRSGADSSHGTIAESTISSYLAIEKREGLAAIGKRLLTYSDTGALVALWRRMFQEDDKLSRAEAQGRDVIALSAFAISALKTPLEKKQLVKEMWQSGADVIVLIDHDTKAGFESIAEAREVLLKLGRKELEDPDTESWPTRGSHVVAPCPHDGACPLYTAGSSNLICGFSQRMQRPEFVRKTKHSGTGHEDVGYSYVVVRRGVRPGFGAHEPKRGRLGLVGKRALQSDLARLQQMQPAELIVDSDNSHIRTRASEDSDRLAAIRDVSEALETEDFAEDIASALRREAYNWPRLIFPPLKRSGHIIIDACTPQGKIMRLTVPKSQGKQPYYDARKSEWGDLFPHEPKNPPQERHQPQRAKDRKLAGQGEDIGKRGRNESRKINSQGKKSYGKLSADIQEQKRKLRRERIRALKIEEID